MWVAEMMFLLEEERNEPEQRVASAMVRLLVTAGSLNSHFNSKYNVRSSKLSASSFLERLSVMSITKTSFCLSERAPHNLLQKMHSNKSRLRLWSNVGHCWSEH